MFFRKLNIFRENEIRCILLSLSLHSPSPQKATAETLKEARSGNSVVFSNLEGKVICDSAKLLCPPPVTFHSSTDSRQVTREALENHRRRHPVSLAPSLRPIAPPYFSASRSAFSPFAMHSLVVVVAAAPPPRALRPSPLLSSPLPPLAASRRSDGAGAEGQAPRAPAEHVRRGDVSFLPLPLSYRFAFLAFPDVDRLPVLRRRRSPASRDRGGAGAVLVCFWKPRSDRAAFSVFVVWSTRV